MLKVQTLKIKNVYDKEQLYLKLENDRGILIINVGQKTWNAAHKLISPQDEKNNKKEVTK